MAKIPRVGSVNTRMQPSLSVTAAARLQELLLTDLLCRPFPGFREKFLFLADGEGPRPHIPLAERSGVGRNSAEADANESSVNAWLDPWPELERASRDHGWVVRRQRGSNLGSRMEHAARGVLSTCESVMVLGTDAPGLPEELLESALLSAEMSAAAITPSSDGGYVAIALRDAGLALLSADIPWGTSAVLSETISLADSLNLSVEVGESWFDIDTVADIERELVECSGARRESLYLTAPRTMKFVDERFLK